MIPKGVVSVALSHGTDHDLPIAAVNKPKGVAIDDEVDAEAPAAEADDAGEEASEE